MLAAVGADPAQALLADGDQVVVLAERAREHRLLATPSADSPQLRPPSSLYQRDAAEARDQAVVRVLELHVEQERRLDDLDLDRRLGRDLGLPEGFMSTPS